MKTKIKVYQQEKKDGLADKLRLKNTLSYAANINVVPVDKLKDFPDLIYKKVLASKEPQPDLYYLRTILVSVGWNANDDVFGKEIVWAARHTPEDKPFNFEHNSKDIIGHITSAYAVDADYNLIDDDTAEDEIPDQYHILTGAVLYKVYDDQKDQERIEKTIAEIEKGEWFVSMEAIFTNFDYALKDKTTGETKIVARNKETSFLTKYLRAYSGSGEYQNYKVGRYLRDIVFCGKGLVRNPANKDSIILLDVEKFNNTPIVAKLTKEELQEKIPEKTEILEKTEKVEINSEKTVYIVADNQQINKGNSIMQELEKLQAELKAATASLALVTSERDSAKAEVAKLTETNKTVSDELAKLKADNILLTERATKAEASLETLKTENGKLVADIAERDAKVKTAARIEMIMSKGFDKNKATETVNLLGKLSDEEFAKFAENHTVATKEKVETPKLTPEELLKVQASQGTNLPMAFMDTDVKVYEKAQADLAAALGTKS